MCLFQLSETLQIDRLGSYIRKEVWPEIMTLTGYTHSWEARHRRRNWISNTSAAIAFDGILPILLFGAGLAAMLTAPELDTTQAILEWTCVSLTLLAPVACGVVFLLRRG